MALKCRIITDDCEPFGANAVSCVPSEQLGNKCHRPETTTDVAAVNRFPGRPASSGTTQLPGRGVRWLAGSDTSTYSILKHYLFPAWQVQWYRISISSDMWMSLWFKCHNAGQKPWRTHKTSQTISAAASSASLHLPHSFQTTLYWQFS